MARLARRVPPFRHGLRARGAAAVGGNTFARTVADVLAAMTAPAAPYASFDSGTVGADVGYLDATNLSSTTGDGRGWDIFPGVSPFATSVTPYPGQFAYDDAFLGGGDGRSVRITADGSGATGYGSTIRAAWLAESMGIANQASTLLGIDGSFESGISGWSAYHGATIASSTAQARHGTKCMSITTDSTAQTEGAISAMSAVGSVAVGTIVTVSLWVRVQIDTGIQIQLQGYQADGVTTTTDVSTTSSTLLGNSGVWTNLSFSYVIASASTSRFAIIVSTSHTTGDAATFYVDDFFVSTTPRQLEYGRSYFAYDAAPALQTQIFQWLDPLSTIFNASLDVAGTITLKGSGASPPSSTSATVLSTNTLYRFEWVVDVTSSNFTINFSIYAGESTTPIETVSLTQSTGATGKANVAGFTWGMISNARTNVMHMWFDEISAGNSAPVGPVGGRGDYAHTSRNINRITDAIVSALPTATVGLGIPATSTNGNSVQSVSPQVGANYAASQVGDLMYIWGIVNGATPTLSSVTDSRGNTWQVASRPHPGGNGTVFFAWTILTTAYAASTDTITVTLSASATTWTVMNGNPIHPPAGYAWASTAVGGADATSATSISVTNPHKSSDNDIVIVTSVGYSALQYGYETLDVQPTQPDQGGPPLSLGSSALSFTQGRADRFGWLGAVGQYASGDDIVVGYDRTQNISTIVLAATPTLARDSVTAGKSKGVAAADTLSSVSDATPTRTKVAARAVSDAISAVSDAAPSRLKAAARAVADAVSAVSDAAPVAGKGTVRAVADAISSVVDAAPTEVAVHFRTASDAISAVADAVPIRTLARLVADTISSVADATPIRAAIRLLADAISAVADASPTEVDFHQRPVADTVSAVADSTPAATRLRPQAVADTISAVADATPTRFKAAARTVSEALVSFGESVARYLGHFLSPTADALVVSAADSAARTVARGAAVADTAVSISEALARTANRILADTISSVADATPVSGVRPARSVADTLSAVSDATPIPTRLRPRTVADTASSVADSAPAVQRGVPRSVIDKLTTGYAANLVANGGFEVDTSGYNPTSYGGGSVVPTKTRDTTQAQFGSASMKLVAVGGASGSQSVVEYQVTGLIPGTTYTASAYCYIAALNTHGLQDRVIALIDDATQQTGIATSSTTTSGFQRFATSWTCTGTSMTIRLYVPPDGTVYFDGVQLEEGSSAAAYVDTNGSRAPGDSVSVSAGRPRTIVDTLDSMSDAAPTRLKAAFRSVADAVSAVSDAAPASQKAAARSTADTLVSTSDTASEAATHPRTASDGLSAVADSTPTPAKAATRTAADAASAVSDATPTVAKAAARTVSDAASAVSDATPSATRLRPRTVADTATSISETLLRVVSRQAADTLAAISDSTARTATRLLSDAISTVADSTPVASGRPAIVVSDAAVSMSDAAAEAALHLRAIADAASTVSDSVATSRARLVSDAISTVSDAAARAATHPRTTADAASAVSDAAPTRTAIRTLSDAAASISDSPSRLATHARAAADAISAVSDSVARAAAHPRTAADAAASIADSAARLLSGARAVADTAVSISDAPTAGKAASRAIADAASAVSDSVAVLRARTVADTLASISDSTAETALHPRAAADAASTVSDAVARSAPRTTADTLASISETPTRLLRATRPVADVAATITDAAGTSGAKLAFVADTAASISDSAVPTRGRAIAVADTLSAIVESTVRRKDASRAPADAAAAISDSTARAATHSRTTADVAATISDTVALVRGRRLSVADALAAIADGAPSVAISRSALDRIASISDSPRVSTGALRAVVDVLVAMSDVATPIAGLLEGTYVASVTILAEPRATVVMLRLPTASVSVAPTYRAVSIAVVDDETGSVEILGDPDSRLEVYS